MSGEAELRDRLPAILDEVEDRLGKPFRTGDRDRLTDAIVELAAGDKSDLEQPQGDGLLAEPMVAERVGVDYRTFHAWVTRGYIRPIRPSEGSGRSAAYGEENVRQAQKLADLRRAGFSIDAAGTMDESRIDAVLAALREPALLSDEEEAQARADEAILRRLIAKLRRLAAKRTTTPTVSAIATNDAESLTRVLDRLPVMPRFEDDPWRDDEEAQALIDAVHAFKGGSIADQSEAIAWELEARARELDGQAFANRGTVLGKARQHYADAFREAASIARASRPTLGEREGRALEQAGRDFRTIAGKCSDEEPHHLIDAFAMQSSDRVSAALERSEGSR